MRPKEMEFCRWMTVYADPVRAAREAGYRHPEKTWAELLSRREIAKEIKARCENIRSVYESTAVCGLYKLAYGGIGDALTLLYRERVSREELQELDLMNVSEIKRTDKGIEIKFCDRMKAIGALAETLGDTKQSGGSSGLLDAIMLSAQALGGRDGGIADGV